MKKNLWKDHCLVMLLWTHNTIQLALRLASQSHSSSFHWWHSRLFILWWHSWGLWNCLCWRWSCRFWRSFYSLFQHTLLFVIQLTDKQNTQCNKQLFIIWLLTVTETEIMPCCYQFKHKHKSFHFNEHRDNISMSLCSEQQIYYRYVVTACYCSWSIMKRWIIQVILKTHLES